MTKAPLATLKVLMIGGVAPQHARLVNATESMRQPEPVKLLLFWSVLQPQRTRMVWPAAIAGKFAMTLL